MGSATVAVPNLVGTSLDAAERSAQERRLKASEAGCPDYSGSPRRLRVKAQEPPPGTLVPEGTTIGVRLTPCVKPDRDTQKALHLEDCRVEAGGFDVQVHDLDCKRAKRLILDLGVHDMNSIRTPVNTRPSASREVVYSDQGWTCWASFIIVGNGNPASGIRYVCSRGDSLLLFTFG